ncbi:hypothetical protein K438DRAFT_1780004 [Mycena galopus ATCC 62051]|nr:hypothetical protein K438DRAFT_1780004 [Mycena galopus ATCC 62051]
MPPPTASAAPSAPSAAPSAVLLPPPRGSLPPPKGKFATPATSSSMIYPSPTVEIAAINPKVLARLHSITPRAITGNCLSSFWDPAIYEGVMGAFRGAKESFQPESEGHQAEIHGQHPTRRRGSIKARRSGTERDAEYLKILHRDSKRQFWSRVHKIPSGDPGSLYQSSLHFDLFLDIAPPVLASFASTAVDAMLGLRPRRHTKGVPGRESRTGPWVVGWTSSSAIRGGSARVTIFAPCPRLLSLHHLQILLALPHLIEAPGAPSAKVKSRRACKIWQQCLRPAFVESPQFLKISLTIQTLLSAKTKAAKQNGCLERGGVPDAWVCGLRQRMVITCGAGNDCVCYHFPIWTSREKYPLAPYNDIKRPKRRQDFCMPLSSAPMWMAAAAAPLFVRHSARHHPPPLREGIGAGDSRVLRRRDAFIRKFGKILNDIVWVTIDRQDCRRFTRPYKAFYQPVNGTL